MRRAALGLLVCAGASAYAAACGAPIGAVDRPSVPSAAPPSASSSPAAVADAGREARAEALATFASNDELVAYVRGLARSRGAATPAGSDVAEPADPSSAAGDMWGDAIGDAFGAGGLGLSGAGEGGGGKGEGIGLGSVGTLGHGAGASSGTGTGATTSVTNTQHAGVDEGGIVKVRGEHLVVLRRGRLFTVRLGDLARVSAVDAFGPDVDPAGAWYDELLVTTDTVVVIGYSYARGGTEIGLFDLDASGHITPRATYHLRGNDYYSSRNYSSRLIGNQLVFYTPLHVRLDAREPLGWLPALRRWKPGATSTDFSTIIAPTHIARPLDPPSPGNLSLHTVTTCDLGTRGPGGEMTCSARGVLGPSGRVFYVSPGAVYVWMTPSTPRVPNDAVRVERPAASLLYRLPLDPKEEPRVLRTRGAPIDQLSFLERDDHLNVLVRAEANGDAMWSAEHSAGAMAMLRVPLSSFTTRAESAPSSAYVPLPEARGGTLHNRFVGDHLLYGTGAGWGHAKKPAEVRVFVHRYAGSTPAVGLALTHGVDRIEGMGDDAIVVGSNGADLTFTSIALDRGGASASGTYTRKGASQGELRSHGFFYRNDGERSGVVALPLRSAQAAGYEHLVEGSASVLYLKHDGLRFRELGALAARAVKTEDDRCRTSCVDWYGNARPLFVRGRVLALMGYEIVEGKLDGPRLEVARRASFAPR